jgi:hypothetical protein
LQYKLCSNGERQHDRHHATRFYFIFLLHAAPNFKSLRDEALCTKKKRVSTQKKEKKKEKESERKKPLQDLLVGKSVTTQASFDNNNTTNKRNSRTQSQKNLSLSTLSNRE